MLGAGGRDPATRDSRTTGRKSPGAEVESASPCRQDPGVPCLAAAAGQLAIATVMCAGCGAARAACALPAPTNPTGLTLVLTPLFLRARAGCDHPSPPPRVGVFFDGGERRTAGGGSGGAAGVERVVDSKCVCLISGAVKLHLSSPRARRLGHVFLQPSFGDMLDVELCFAISISVCRSRARRATALARIGSLALAFRTRCCSDGRFALAHAL